MQFENSAFLTRKCRTYVNLVPLNDTFIELWTCQKCFALELAKIAKVRYLQGTFHGPGLFKRHVLIEQRWKYSLF